MKVLFAVSTEDISEKIIKIYQKEHKEIISSKNVYYFNAIIKELQRNQTYDRIVISEDLEPFTNNNYDAIDKFIFEKLDGISDEAIDSQGRDIPIIVICSERREKSDNLLVKLFSIGVYDALIGNDRSIEEVCKLLNKPRTKREAKAYYKIEQGEYEYEDDKNVSEVEIQNILSHYRRLGKNEDRYVTSFDDLAEQYNDEQLKIIIKFLPIGVKAVLEANSPKYQSIMTYKPPLTKKEEAKKNSLNISKIAGLHSKQVSGPIIIPSTVKTSEVKKISESDSDDEDEERKKTVISNNNIKRRVQVNQREQVKEQREPVKKQSEEVTNKTSVQPQRVQPQRAQIQEQQLQRTQPQRAQIQEQQLQRTQSQRVQAQVEQQQRLQPQKAQEPEKPQEDINIDDTNAMFEDLENIEGVEPIAPIEPITPIETQLEQPVKRGRGRPRKNPPATEEELNKPKRGRGRPRKNQPVEEGTADVIPQEEAQLPGFEDEEKIIEIPKFGDEETRLPGYEYEEENELPGLEEQEDEIQELPGFEGEEDEVGLPGFDDEVEETEDNEEDGTLPGFDDEEQELPGFEEQEDEEQELPGFEDDEEENREQPKFEDEDVGLPGFDEEEKETPEPEEIDGEEDYNTPSNKKLINKSEEKIVDISYLLTQDKKMVAFVGTSKNGVSFLVNNIAEILSKKGIKTAIMDLTRNKNSYYIYTENKEELREIAYASMENLKQGKPIGIEVNDYLTVYTSSPNIRNTNYSIESMLTTLAKNYSLVLLDCDYSTNKEYFRAAQEIYMIQSMDVLTIQPLTEFLRRLKLNEILQPEKLRAVVNKAQKVKNLNEEMIVGGMSTYNDPEMSIQDRLFDMKTIQKTVIPFDIDAYKIYLEGIANCEITTKGYNRDFMGYLNRLAQQVYPEVFAGSKKKQKKNKKMNNYEEGTKFSEDMSNTLSQMKQYK